MSQPAITLKLWLSPIGYQVELQDHLSNPDHVWEWSGCQDCPKTTSQDKLPSCFAWTLGKRLKNLRSVTPDFPVLLLWQHESKPGNSAHKINNIMNREQVLRDYKVQDGRIVSPGKFEGEPIFAPYFWELALEGFADSDNGTVFGFRLQMHGQDANNPFAPELKQWLGRKRSLKLYEDSQGFVHCR